MTMDRQEFQVINALARSDRTFWELVVEVDFTVKGLFERLKRLEAEGSISYSGGRFHLEDEALREVVRTDFDEEMRRFSDVAKDRPPSVLEFFQGPLTDRDVFKRIRFIYDRGDLVGKEFFIIGDDDLFSIALALTGLPGRITVVEIDKRLVALINEMKDNLGLDIEVIELNCAEPLPDRYLDSYDVFICDPVETVPGFRTFMSRGISALRHPGAVYFGLTEAECPPENWHRYQKDILDMGLVITDVRRKFSFYSEEAPHEDHDAFDDLKICKESPFPLSPPDIDWYSSSFIRLQTVKRPTPIIEGKVEFDDSFYDNEYVMSAR